MKKTNVSKSKRFILLSLLMLILMAVTVAAQTGLFGGSATPFLSFGIIALIAFAVFKIVFDNMKRK